MQYWLKKKLGMLELTCRDRDDITHFMGNLV